MGHPFLCVLCLYLTNSLLKYGHAEVSSRAVLTMEPNWTMIFPGEVRTFSCGIQGNESTEWEYEWKTPTVIILSTSNNYEIMNADASATGEYKCRARRRDSNSATEWSETITLTFFNRKPKLTVSPSWLNSGDSVTLSCDVEDPSPGWRFYWYKAVPKLSDDSYSYELLPDSSSGTKQNSYTLYGQTYTAGYVCQAGRGDPVQYTKHSEEKFVWSGDFQSGFLSVSSDRVQHFTSDSITLSCEGNAAEWKVRSYKENRFWSEVPECRTMTEATCTIPRLQEGDTVYWCESGSGEFSNAVNISAYRKNVILGSPVHPVSEGDSLTLSCQLKTETLDCTATFFLNGQTIGSNANGKFHISMVSKSDEGFYKCKCGRMQSSESWVAVQAVGSSALVFSLTGLLIGVVGIVLVLLLIYFIKYKDSYCSRAIPCLHTKQGSAAELPLNHGETQQHVYCALSHADPSIYESADQRHTADDEVEHEYSNISHSPVQLNSPHRSIQMENHEDYINSQWTLDTAED